MAEQEQDTSSLESFALPYRPGEFQEVANRLLWLVDSLERQKVAGLIPQEMRSAAAALTRAEGLLSGSQEAAAGAVPDVAESPAAAELPTQEADTGRVVGERGQWQGWVASQPEIDHVRGGQLRVWFYLAQHPDPADREKTEWARCYALGRHAEGLQKKFAEGGRAVGAEIVVRGSFQGVRQVTRRDKSVVDEQSVYVYGFRMVRPPKQGPGQ